MILALDIGDSVQNFSDELFTWLPRLIGALVILLIFYVVAKIVRTVLAKALSSAGIDRAVRSGKYGEYVAQYASGFTPSAVIASTTTNRLSGRSGPSAGNATVGSSFATWS